MLSSSKTIDRSLSDQFPVLYQHRYCDQEEFSIGVFSCDNYSEDVSKPKHFLLNNFDTKLYLPSLSIPKFDCKAVASSSNVYLAGQLYGDDNTLSVEKYSFSTNNWNKVALLEGVIELRYEVCSFMQKVFVISGAGYEEPSLLEKPSWFYNKDTNKWTSIASIMELREGSACTVFEGKIVVSGGFRKEIIPNRVYPGGMVNLCLLQRLIYLNTIEAYDYHENKWSCLPSMLSPRVNHTAVSISNKMIMIGGNSENSEIFDSITRKFTYIKTFPKWVGKSKIYLPHRFNNPYQVVDIANKIYFFCIKNMKVKVYRYDVRNDSFTFVTSRKTESLGKFSCIKVPMI